MYLTMPAHPSDHPIQRADINLYTADILWLRANIGNGWTSYVRELVHKDILAKTRVKATIGDLIDE